MANHMHEHFNSNVLHTMIYITKQNIDHFITSSECYTCSKRRVFLPLEARYRAVELPSIPAPITQASNTIFAAIFVVLSLLGKFIPQGVRGRDLLFSDTLQTRKTVTNTLLNDFSSAKKCKCFGIRLLINKIPP